MSEQDQTVQVEAKEQVPLATYPLNQNLKNKLKEYLNGREGEAVAKVVADLELEQIPGESIQLMSQLLLNEFPVRLMMGIQQNIQQVNMIRLQAARQAQQAQQSGEVQADADAPAEETTA